MLSSLASPTVCVIDDEQADYKPILSALNELHVSCVHLSGEIAGLPTQPFGNLQLVFLDLHLTATIGKNAASYTANVFRKVVSLDTAPIIVVIWSKYAADKVETTDVPPDDQETEAQLFKRTLLDAEPAYDGRLIFVEMAKPKEGERPADWHNTLKAEIARSLQGQSAVEALWSWNGLIKDACTKVSKDLTAVAKAAIAGTTRDLSGALKATMQKLARAQSEGDFAAATAPKHLLTVLTQLLLDQLENGTGVASMATHGAWLSESPPGVVPSDFAGRMNGLLLTSESTNAAVYAPGTVFHVADPAEFSKAFGKDVSELLSMWIKTTATTWAAWQRDARPVLIELSPVCDLAQSNRVSALLVAGVIAPASYEQTLSKSGDAFGKIAKFYLRWPVSGLMHQEVILGYCNRYKITLPAEQPTNWLTPCLRLRELPLAAIRNSNAAHAARVGFVSL